MRVRAMDQFLASIVLVFCLKSAHCAVNIIAHMTNTPNAVFWALDGGANGVELDLQFEGNEPSRFQHSLDIEPCDCTCLCPFTVSCPENNVCQALVNATGSHCTALSSLQAMTRALSDPRVISRLAIIYIDSKLTNSMTDFAAAGASVVHLLNKHVMERGYGGQVILDANYVIYSDYLKGAQEAALYSRYGHRYFYTYGSERGNSERVWTALSHLQTSNIVYLTGVSVCLPLKFIDDVKANAAKASYAAVGVWTLDRASSMREYIDAGVDFILTNEPKVALEVIGSSDVPSVGRAIIAKNVSPVAELNWKCECTYHKGGCTISRSAPPNSACRCSYKGAWTCGGQTIPCPDSDVYICIKPDSSRDACQFGGGDCGGY